MKVVNLYRGAYSIGNSYIISNDKNEAIAIDMGVNAEYCLDYLKKNNLTLLKILLTHGHYDHIAGVSETAEKTGAEVYIHSADSGMLDGSSDNLEFIMKSCARKVDFMLFQAKETACRQHIEYNPVYDRKQDLKFRVSEFRPSEKFSVLSDGDIIDFSGVPVKVIHTPGHTAGSCSFRINDAFFTGDMYFSHRISLKVEYEPMFFMSGIKIDSLQWKKGEKDKTLYEGFDAQAYSESVRSMKKIFSDMEMSGHSPKIFQGHTRDDVLFDAINRGKGINSVINTNIMIQDLFERK